MVRCKRARACSQVFGQNGVSTHTLMLIAGDKLGTLGIPLAGGWVRCRKAAARAPIVAE